MLFNFLKTIAQIFIGKKALPVHGSRLKAHIKLSALITEIKGSIGGTTFSNVQSGAVAKLKTVFGGKGLRSPVKKTASSQVALWSGCMANESNAGYLQPDGSIYPSTRTVNILSNFSIVSKAWGSLLESDRQAWSELAKNVIKQSKIGAKYTGSGFSLYKEVNGILLNAGLSPVARPSCRWVLVIPGGGQDDDGIVCYVCGDEIKYCLYEFEDPDAHNAPAIRQGYFDASGANGYLNVAISPPFSPGRYSGSAPRSLAIIKKNSTYKSYIFNIILNQFYGSAIYGRKYNFSQSLINSGGAFIKTIVNASVLSAPLSGQKILYTLKQEVFVWNSSGVTWDFGTVGSGITTSKTFLPFGCTLAPLSAYTIEITQGIEANFSIVYGDPDDPLSLSDLLTDKYGNILPIPLKINFSPLSSGSKSASLTITCGAESVSMEFTGIGS